MMTDTIEFDSIESVIEDIRNGKMVILVDDEDRENEGDLVCAADKVTPEIINFMSKYGRGLICLALDSGRTAQLRLPPMVDQNQSPYRTNFTVSIEAATGVTTGISAADRARTIQAAMNLQAEPADLIRPGHIFPLEARDGGVLVRAGHTEGAVDLSKLAGCIAGGVICEVLHDDGSMARAPQLKELAGIHGLKIATIASLIEYRRRHETLVKKMSEARLPTAHGDFQVIGFQSILDDSDYIALVKGKWDPSEPVLVRVHSQCLTGDVFGSYRCDCGDQLHRALEMVDHAGKGVVLYLPQEGRGIGIINKIKAYHYQDHGSDTVEANEKLGFKGDLREYGIGAQVLRMLGVHKMKLMTNNPKKIVGIQGYDLEVVERVPIQVDPHPDNKDYLLTKQEKMGHLLNIPQ